MKRLFRLFFTLMMFMGFSVLNSDSYCHCRLSNPGGANPVNKKVCSVWTDYAKAVREKRTNSPYLWCEFKCKKYGLSSKKIDQIPKNQDGYRCYESQRDQFSDLKKCHPGECDSNHYCNDDHSKDYPYCSPQKPSGALCLTKQNKECKSGRCVYRNRHVCL